MTAVLEEAPPQLRPFGELRAETGFAWSCHTGETCEISGSDRDEYTAHHQAHGRAVALTDWQQPKPWTPPRRQPYKPKPMDPGQPVTWVKITQAHWEGRVYFSDGGVLTPGTWVEEAREERTGTVWSTAYTASQWWVLPDDDPGRPVLVYRHGKKFSFKHRQGELYEITGCAEAARDAVLRGELVRRRGIYPVLDAVYTDTSWRGRRETRTYLKWHTDPDCPLADGKEWYDHEAHGHALGWSCDHYGLRPWTPLDVAIALTRSPQPPSELCDRCITGLPAELPEHQPEGEHAMTAAVTGTPVALIYTAPLKAGAHGRVHRATCKHVPKTATPVPVAEATREDLAAATLATCCSVTEAHRIDEQLRRNRAEAAEAATRKLARVRASTGLDEAMSERNKADTLRAAAAGRAKAGSVADFITAALTALAGKHPDRAASGFTITELAKSGAAYAGKGAAPSVGAIVARLDRGRDTDPFTVTSVNGRKGAVAR